MFIHDTRTKILILACLLPITANMQSTTKIQCKKKEERIKINSPALRLVDGTPKIKVESILRLINNIDNLSETKKTIKYHGNLYSVQNLVVKEHKGQLSGDAIKIALADAVEQFRAFSANYLNEARDAKTQMQQLIKKWAEQRGIEQSILLDWSRQPAGQEHEEFKKLVKNFVIFDEFLNHLRCFLADLLESCKQSLAQYQAAQQQNKKR